MKTHTNTIKAMAILCGSLFGTLAAEARELTGIRSIVYAGTGCPQGTLSAQITGSRDGLDFVIDGMSAEAGTGISLREGRKNCQVMIDLQVPSGWTYAVKRAEFKGWYDMERGTQGYHRLATYFQGQADTGTTQLNFNGTNWGYYDLIKTVPASELVWSPCGLQRALNINTSVSVRSYGGSYGVITVDPETIPLGNLQLAFRRC